MTQIIIYLLLIGINLPFALDKNYKLRHLHWFAMGFNFSLLCVVIINLII
jgi:hypothetical protein